MKTALVLEGGAMRGIYTAGVIDVLLDAKIKIDCVIGVSAGALFGVNYVSKQKGRVLRYNKNYINDKRYFGFSSLIKTGDIMNKDFCFNELVYNLDKFDFETFKKSKTDFYAVVTNLKTGHPEYKKIDDLEVDMEYLRASGSMPIVSKIVEIDGHKYLDGGISDSIPVLKAIELGYDRVIVVLTRDINYRKKKSNTSIYKLMYKDYPKFIETVSNRYKDYNDTVEKIIELEKENKIFVIRPSEELTIKRLNKDINKLDETYSLGVKDMNNLLKDLKSYLR